MPMRMMVMRREKDERGDANDVCKDKDDKQDEPEDKRKCEE